MHAWTCIRMPFPCSCVIGSAAALHRPTALPASMVVTPASDVPAPQAVPEASLGHHHRFRALPVPQPRPLLPLRVSMEDC